MRILVVLINFLLLLHHSFSVNASSINYDFTTDTTAVTVSGAPSSIEAGSLKIIVDENSTKWSVNMLIVIDKDIFDNPEMEMKYKVGTHVDAMANFPITLKIDGIYTTAADEGNGRIYPAINLNSTEWQYFTVDLQPLIDSWELNHGKEHGNIQEITMTLGNNKGPFVADELYIDYIRMGDKLSASSGELNPENLKEIQVDLGLPASGIASVSNFTVKRNGSSLNIDSVYIRDESFLIFSLENPIEIPREVADKPQLEITYNGNDDIQDASGIPLEAFEIPISIQAAVENRWKYWGKYIFSDIPYEAEWFHKDTVVDNWDWSVPGFVEADSLAYFWFKSDPNTEFSCKNLNSVYIQWNELEPVKGEYKFDWLRQRIEDAAVGYDGVSMRLLASVWKWETFPEPGGDVPGWLAGRTNAPRWMDEMDIAKIPMDDEGVAAINMDIMDPDYHALYKKLIKALGESGIPDMPELKVVNVCYRSASAGEEFTKYHPKNNAVEAQYSAETVEKRTKERLDVWAEAFGDHTRKLMYVGHGSESYVSYAGELGMGSRQGFVEMYNYTVESPQFGFTVNRETRYSEVDETNPFIVNNPALGDENEEYTSEEKFGWKESFQYRYYVASFRMLQQRRNYVMHAPNTLNPELTWYLGYVLSRKVENTPDAFAMLSEFYLSNTNQHNDLQGPLKNIERWLYQRDFPGYETTPAMQVPTAKDLWYADKNKPYDYTARKGKKIGFDVDDRLFPDGEQAMAVKVTFYDGVAGKLKLVYKDNEGVQSDSVTSNGEDIVRTATFFINARMDDTGFDHDFDFILESEEEVPVFFTRVLKTEESYQNKDQQPFGGVNNTIPGFIEGEHYDLSLENLSYNDDDQKQGDVSQRPNDMVDIVSKEGASNGFSVGHTAEGEWLEYTVDVTQGRYNITLHYFCGADPGKLMVLLDGEEISTISGMENKGWGTKNTITMEKVQIKGGNDLTLRLEFIDGAGFDLDAIEFVEAIVPVLGVHLSGCPTDTIEVGQSYHLSAILDPVDPDDSGIIWSSSNTDVASVNQNGLVNCLAEGNATITVTTTDGGHTDVCAIVAVKPYIAVSGVRIDNCPRSILKTGESLPLTPLVIPVDASDTLVYWSSSNADVASIDENGMLLALSQGSTVITLRSNDGDFSNTCNIGVQSTGISVEGIEISNCIIDTLLIDSTYHFEANVLPANADNHKVSWSSSDENIARVDENGVVSGGAAGSAIITVIATSDDGFFSDECAVVVDNDNNVQKMNFAGRMKVYPNPVSDRLFFEFPQTNSEKSISVYNLTGNLLISKRTTATLFTINVETIIDERILLISVNTEGETAYFKVVIE